jgi:hypothetical protein
MVDITEISAMVVAAGVLVGVAYYILDMRNQSKLRQTDILSRIYSKLTDRDLLEAWQRFSDFDAKDPVALREKHDSVGFFTVDNQMVLKACDEVGVLLMKKLIDIDLVGLLLRDQIYFAWAKAKPFIEDARETYKMPNLDVGLEYLYNELKKREQQK